MEIEEIAKGLCSKTRLNILAILAQGNASAINVYKAYNERFPDKKQRVTIYRELETLFSFHLLFKRYDEENKEIIYGLANRSIIIDLIELQAKAGP